MVNNTNLLLQGNIVKGVDLFVEVCGHNNIQENGHCKVSL